MKETELLQLKELRKIRDKLDSGNGDTADYVINEIHRLNEVIKSYELYINAFNTSINSHRSLKIKAEINNAVSPYRVCSNCGHDNTKEESSSKCTCKYCEGESDTNW